MEEIWKDIIGYEGYYQVSSIGRVRGLRRTVGDRFLVELPEKIMATSLNDAGYAMVDLYMNSNRKTMRVHRLVATAFIENPQNKPQVNHKNSIRNDNDVSNLEWCTPSENTQHGYDFGFLSGYWTGKVGAKNHSSIPIIQMDMLGNEIKEFAGQCEAERETGIFQTNIGKVCLGKRKSAGGFKWKFKDE